MWLKRDHGPRKRVVIVGGGFSGVLAARECHDFEVILIDRKDYFEYTPGILRCFVEPDHYSKISIKFADLIRNNPSYRHVQFVQDCVVDVQERYILTEKNVKYSFDYIIIACGSGYSDPIGTADTKWEDRLAHFHREAKKIKEAKKILVAGSGPVGVELCSEILEKHPEKELHFILGNNEVSLHQFPLKSGKYVQENLKKKGVHIHALEALDRVEGKRAFTSKGNVLEMDEIFWCIGKSTASKPVGSSLPQVGKKSKDSSRELSVAVNDHLQVEGHPHIYVVGDAAKHPALSLDLAFNAELSASMVVHNIVNQEKGIPLPSYPKAMTGVDDAPVVAVVSLGKFDASLVLNTFVLNGSAAAATKWIIEWSKMLQVKGNVLGKFIWALGDIFMINSHRYIFVPLRKKEN